MSTAEEVITRTGDVDVIADLTRLGQEPHPLARNTIDVGGHAFLIPAGATLHIVHAERFADRPSRPRGEIVVSDLTSFLDLFGKHSTGTSEIYADITCKRITAVLNAAAGGDASWADHRLHLVLQTSPQWQEWKAIDNKLHQQTDFAEFIESHLADIRDPEANVLLEVAQSLSAHKGVQFESSIRLTDGQRQFKYVETQNAKAGQKGDITIPVRLLLAIAPWVGSDTYQVEARFRYRIGSNGELVLGVKLDNAERVLEAAFEGIVGEIRQATVDGVVVARGSAPASPTVSQDIS